MVCTHIQNGRWIRDERRGYEKGWQGSKTWWGRHGYVVFFCVPSLSLYVYMYVGFTIESASSNDSSSFHYCDFDFYFSLVFFFSHLWVWRGRDPKARFSPCCFSSFNPPIFSLYFSLEGDKWQEFLSWSSWGPTYIRLVWHIRLASP